MWPLGKRSIFLRSWSSGVILMEISRACVQLKSCCPDFSLQPFSLPFPSRDIKAEINKVGEGEWCQNQPLAGNWQRKGRVTIRRLWAPQNLAPLLSSNDWQSCYFFPPGLVVLVNFSLHTWFSICIYLKESIYPNEQRLSPHLLKRCESSLPSPSGQNALIYFWSCHIWQPLIWTPSSTLLWKEETKIA